MRKPRFQKKAGFKEPPQRSQQGETARAIAAAAKRLADNSPTDFNYGRRKKRV